MPARLHLAIAAMLNRLICLVITASSQRFLYMFLHPFRVFCIDQFFGPYTIPCVACSSFVFYLFDIIFFLAVPPAKDRAVGAYFIKPGPYRAVRIGCQHAVATVG